MHRSTAILDQVHLVRRHVAQAEDMPVVRQRLAEKGIKFIEAHVEEAGMVVTQVLSTSASRRSVVCFSGMSGANYLQPGSWQSEG